MARFTTQQSFTYLETTKTHALLVQTNGGSLLVEAYDGVSYIQTDTVTADGANEIFISGQSMRFTPSGGCIYTIDEGV